MSPTEWKKLTPKDQGQLWSLLSEQERAAIISADKAPPASAPARVVELATPPSLPAEIIAQPGTPGLAITCYVLAFLDGAIGIALLGSHEASLGVACLSGTLVAIIGGNVLTSLAATAYYSRVSANMLAALATRPESRR